MAEESVTEIEEISAKGRTSPLEIESPRLALGRTSPAYFDSVDTPKNDEVMQPFICKRVCVCEGCLHASRNSKLSLSYKRGSK